MTANALHTDRNRMLRTLAREARLRRSEAHRDGLPERRLNKLFRHLMSRTQIG